jgi:RimJ/RimL family protein N-acetyltransferase
VFARTLDISSYPHGRLRLIKPSLEHAPLSLKWLSDPEVGRYMGADFSGVSIATEKQRIRDILAGDDTYGWMIELDGQVIGAIEVNRIKELSAEYGVKTGNFSTLIGDKQHWGKRIAPHAKRAIMDWGFTVGGFKAFVGRALASNTRSWHSLEHLGFEFRGLKPDTVNGQPVEWRTYIMTKERWQKITDSLP